MRKMCLFWLALLMFTGGKKLFGGEARGLWVRGVHINSPEKIERIIKVAKENNFNTLFVQIYVAGYVYYNSEFVPQSEDLEAEPFDPLLLCIEEGHKNGIEIHAWFNTYLVWSRESRPTAENHILYTYPEWMLDDREGTSMSEYTKKDIVHKGLEGIYLDPENDAVKDYLYRLFMEVATKYDIDGIHFDFVRYPGSAYGYSAKQRLTFKRQSGIDPLFISSGYSPARSVKLGASLYASWQRYHYLNWSRSRAQHVTDLVKRVSRGVKKVHPGISVSAAVFPNVGKSFYIKNQAWQEWLRQGIIDIVVPMVYTGTLEDVSLLIAAAVENSHNQLVYAGLGAFVKKPQQIEQEIAAARKKGADGVVLFFYEPAFEHERFLRYIKRHAFPEPASIPKLLKGIAAVVNGENISMREVMKRTGAGVSQKEALQRIIDEKLLLKEAVKRGVTVSDAEMQQYWTQIQNQFISQSEFYKQIFLSGQEEDEYRLKLRDELKIIKLLDKEVYDKTKISPTELVLSPKQVKYSDIYVSCPKDTPGFKKLWPTLKIRILLFLLRRGVSFTKIAKFYSENKKAPYGGDCGWTTLDKKTWITEILETLDEEELSSITRTRLGFLIFKVDEIKESEQLPYGKLTPSLQRIVFQKRLKGRYNRFISHLRSKALIEIRSPG